MNKQRDTWREWVMFFLGLSLASQCYTIAIWALRLTCP